MKNINTSLNKIIYIKVIGDLICPWCYLGCTSLNKAIDQRPHFNIHIKWQPFYINPNMPISGISRKSYLENKFGKNEKIITSQIINSASKADIPINLDKIKFTPNTKTLHNLITAINENEMNVGFELSLNFMNDYFINGQDLRDENYIFKVFEKFKIKKNFKNLDSKLNEKYIINEFDNDFISGVPVFIFNNKWVLSGAQSIKSLLTSIDLSSHKS